MGWDYAFVHLTWTIPMGLVLGLIYWPLLTKQEIVKTGFIVSIAVVSTIPWDSYLIQHRIWTYPPDAITGLTFWGIPAEELFFFVIQTVNTSLLYLLLSKSTFYSIYLGEANLLHRVLGQILLALVLVYGAISVHVGGEGLYLGLILVWACPFLLLIWSLTYQSLIKLPLTNTLLPIVLMTLHLWIVDTLALRRGTWSISSGTKHGIEVVRGLDIEEAIFFFVTNILIVWGQVAFDTALAVLHTFPELFPKSNGLPGFGLLLQAILLPKARYDKEKISGLVNAASILRRKSRSFYLASGTLEGRIRIDFIQLYAFCRASDDLVDEATSASEADAWIGKLREYLRLSYEGFEDESQRATRSRLCEYVTSQFPKKYHSALLQLPTSELPREPLDDLLNGFATDVLFDQPAEFPMATTEDLDLYGRQVAGTVAELCIRLVYLRTSQQGLAEAPRHVVNAGAQMGIALQYVNIARDIEVDAKLGRVYIPVAWLKDQDLSAEDVIRHPSGQKVNSLRQRLLDRAFAKYEVARGAIEELPSEARAPMRVAIESYMEIGRILRQLDYAVRPGRATVPLTRRLKVAWMALMG
ncbi:Squalene/phytoene synthase-domain-containing protein [Thelonectria olida]|uniref:Bifunctional lycopene cyclase/phytoene synthase n=1 Tax=Thelonectria olida TaxID=1576542 RepID=A0A9P8W2X5_9HYPO|nr:Squalene/phytoene synthase-domain-containing protein [Thelonectria olida]